MDKLVEILHEILDLLPFRTESHAKDLHAKVTDLNASEVADNGGSDTGGNVPVGRNLTTPGVVTGTDTGTQED